MRWWHEYWRTFHVECLRRLVTQARYQKKQHDYHNGRLSDGATE